MIRKLLMILPLLALTACGGNTTIPDDHYYRLPAPVLGSEHAPLTEGAIFVEQFLADGIQRERALVYATGSAPTELLQRHYHFWMDSPSRLLRDQLVDYLRAANAGKSVTDVPEVPAELSIYGKIRRLDHIVKSSGSPEVVVALEFRVQKAGTEAPLFVRMYERTMRPDDTTVEAAVAAFGKALDEIFSQLVEDIGAG